MRLLKRAKEYIAQRALNNNLASLKRQVRVCNIVKAKNVGILYDATNPASFDVIKAFTKDLLSRKIEVSALGYVHSKKLIDHYLYRKGFEFFTRNDLNWYQKPVNQTVDQFIKKPFDILINLSLVDWYPLQFITALSKATFKIGCFFNQHAYPDVMIDIERERQAMLAIKSEITRVKGKKLNGAALELERDIDHKVELEQQLNFLINQIMHYLSIFKSN